jgi:acetyl-CoA acetyltransferase
LSDVVPGTTVDRQCGSSQQAVHFAAQAVMSGHHGRRGGWGGSNDVVNPHFLSDGRRSGLRV